MAFRTLAAVIVASIVFSLVGVLVYEANVLPNGAASGELLGWPWPAEDAWSFAADLGQALIFGFVLAWFLRFYMRNTDGSDLRLWPVVVAVVISAPATRGLEWLAGFALIVVVARAVAWQPCATPARRPSRPAKIALALGAALLVLTSFSYQPLHPLLATFSDRDNPLMDTSLGVVDSNRMLGFVLRNEGMGATTVRSVRVVGWETSLVDVVGRHSQTVVGTVLDRGEELTGSFVVGRTTCRTAAARDHFPTAYVDALEVRVQTLGIERTQRFDIEPNAALNCH